MPDTSSRCRARWTLSGPRRPARGDARGVESYIDNNIRENRLETAFPTCAGLVRAREHMYAISLYGNTILDAARNASNLFPVTDLDVDFGFTYWGRPLGVAARGVEDADEARRILANALSTQNEYLVDLALDHPTEPEELAQIAMLADRFLSENPAYEDIHSAIVQLEGLLSLELTGTSITDEGIAHIANLSTLETLQLNNTDLTDAGLIHLGRLERLETLGLLGVDITDTGLATIAGSLPSLGTLNVMATNVTRAGSRAFVQQRPRVEFQGP